MQELPVHSWQLHASVVFAAAGTVLTLGFGTFTHVRSSRFRQGLALGGGCRHAETNAPTIIRSSHVRVRFPRLYDDLGARP